MRSARFTETQIVSILNEAEAGPQLLFIFGQEISYEALPDGGMKDFISASRRTLQ
jgi:hypothetical protein